MFETILAQWGQVPIYLAGAFKEHRAAVIVLFLFYLIALIFAGKLGTVFRWVYVIAGIGLAIYAYIRGNWSLLWVLAASLLVMIIYKVIYHSVRSIKQSRIDRRIERQALEKAAQRRGDWRNKQAYSGAPKPIVRDGMNPAQKMTKSEVRDVVENVSLTDAIDDAPKDPMAEIEAVKAELSAAVEKAITAQIDTEAVNKAAAQQRR